MSENNTSLLLKKFHKRFTQP